MSQNVGKLRYRIAQVPLYRNYMETREKSLLNVNEYKNHIVLLKRGRILYYIVHVHVHYYM